MNDKPHLGHAYTTIAADVLARYHRSRGDSVFFLTGTDEHGKKVQDAAKAAGMEIKPFLDGLVDHSWRPLWKLLHISNDDFIRTTEPRHELVSQKVFAQLFKSGDIYLGDYEGWYCVSDESFWLERELKNGSCPSCGRKVDRVKEPSYFFRLSKYQKKLLEFYQKNDSFVLPPSRRNEMIPFIQAGLQDVSVSRATVSWGTQIQFDPKQTIYVWFEALLNYASAIGYQSDSKKFNQWWAPDLQLVGKEIVRFHAVLWPAMLLALKLPLPKTIFGHGWLTVNNQKMGKSLGNAIDPVFLCNRYGVDSFRYFLLREIPFGEDGDFSEGALKQRHNSELANELGNLLNRTISMIDQYNGGKIPKGKSIESLQKEFDSKKIASHIEKLEFHQALAELFRFVNVCNKFVNDQAPWKQDGAARDNTLYSVADALRLMAISLEPFMPSCSESMFRQLGCVKGSWKELKFNQLKSGTQTKKGALLFQKIV